MCSLFPIAIANTNDCKGTFEGVLRRFVDDLIDFENGVELYFDRNRAETLYGTLVGVKGDAKAIHALLGFIDPGGARHFCRDCMISRPELHIGEIAFGVPRTRALTDRDLGRVEENNNYSTECGLRHRTVLHDSVYFRLEDNKNSDILHDFAEGIIPMVIRLCLKEIIYVQRLFNVNDINERIFSFNYGKANQADKPNIVFTDQSLREAHRLHNIKQNGAQTLLLFRALPFLLDNISPRIAGVENSDHYQLYLLLMKIYQIAMAPRVPRDIIPLLRRYLEQFRRGWYIVFPGVNPTNKFHHIMHLPQFIEEKGPARQFACFREESKNCFIKRHISICNNFINPQKTAMEQALIFQANAWGGRDLHVLQKTRHSRIEVKTVQERPCSASLEALGLPSGSHVQTVKMVNIYGAEYRQSQYLLILPESESEDGLPCFGMIATIILPAVRTDPETVIFCVKACVTDGLEERFNAYKVSFQENAPYHLIDLHDLPHHSSISQWHSFSSGNIYLNQQVDGADFLGFTEELILKNFPKILYKQRTEIMKLVNQCNSTEPTEDSQCVVFGYLDSQGNVVESSPDDSLSETLLSKSCLSKSLIVDVKLNTTSKVKAKKRPHNVDEVEAMPVYDILNNQGVLGQSVIRFIGQNKWISATHQSNMLKILVDYFIGQGGNLYPSSAVKTSMAKGIVADFPDLADEDGGFSSWYNQKTSRGIIQTKFQTLRDKLPVEEKKNKPKAVSTVSDSCLSKRAAQGSSSESQCPGSSSRTQSSSSGQPASNIICHSVSSLISSCQSSLELSSELELNSIRGLVPTSGNFLKIFSVLKKTFVDRRKWIKADGPTCTEIIDKFHHLGSYEGRMISEEFQMLFPLANNFPETFKRWAPHIIQYAKTAKPALVESLNREFPESPSKETTVSLLLLPKLLPSVATSKTMKPSELDHIKLYKSSLDALVSSAIVQIEPEGTNAKLHCSIEAPRNEAQRKQTIFPYLLWLTNDRTNGQMYLKIDQITFYLGSSTTLQDLLLRGVDLIMKAYWTFNLSYHPFLKTTYLFLETLYGINTSSNSSVTKFMNSLRGISSASQ
ncbi:Thymidylate kinase [Frankliniella fusca]|uniref:Thymidylate kinase n=1 Tax=Frankliniella fusca TaxID=407009 RepID=A0AAE1HMH5_9NEOP|nr:Thymidylate kinase [Frankliniella fusca]